MKAKIINEGKEIDCDVEVIQSEDGPIITVICEEQVTTGSVTLYISEELKKNKDES